MNRSITPWSIVLGAALIALPASGLAQTPPQPPQQQSAPEQPPATPPSQAQPPATQPPATDPGQAEAAQHGEQSDNAGNLKEERRVIHHPSPTTSARGLSVSYLRQLRPKLSRRAVLPN